MDKQFSVNICDYYSESQIKEMIRDQISLSVKKSVQESTDRLLSNTAYFATYKFLDDVFDDEQKQLIKEKVKQIISKMNEATVFTEKYWLRDVSLAKKIMNDTVIGCRDEIVDKTKNMIQNFNFESALEDDCMEILKDAILKKLSHKCDE